MYQYALGEYGTAVAKERVEAKNFVSKDGRLRRRKRAMDRYVLLMNWTDRIVVGGRELSSGPIGMGWVQAVHAGMSDGERLSP